MSHEKSNNNLRQRFSVVLVVLVLLLLCFWKFGTRSNLKSKSLPADAVEELTGPVMLLPYEGMPLTPYQKPTVAMPVCQELFRDVAFFMNDKNIKSGDQLHFKSGQQVKVRMVVNRNDKIPLDTTMGANGIGLACRANNNAGWMIVDDQFWGNKTTDTNSIAEGIWSVPDKRGEFILAVLGDAAKMGDDIPIRIVRSYPLTIEK